LISRGKRGKKPVGNMRGFIADVTWAIRREFPIEDSRKNSVNSILSSINKEGGIQKGEGEGARTEIH